MAGQMNHEATVEHLTSQLSIANNRVAPILTKFTLSYRASSLSLFRIVNRINTAERPACVAVIRGKTLE